MSHELVYAKIGCCLIRVSKRWLWQLKVSVSPYNKKIPKFSTWLVMWDTSLRPRWLLICGKEKTWYCLCFHSPFHLLLYPKFMYKHSRYEMSSLQMLDVEGTLYMKQICWRYWYCRIYTTRSRSNRRYTLSINKLV